MTTGPEAGYYADPSIPGYIRYWDGTQWVPGTSRPAPDMPQQPEQQTVRDLAQDAIQDAIEDSGQYAADRAYEYDQAALQQSVAAQLAQVAAAPAQIRDPASISVSQPAYPAQPDHPASQPAYPIPQPAYPAQPDEAAAQGQVSSSVSTMVVPSAFGNRGAYGSGWASGGSSSPFDAIPGLYRSNDEPEEPAQPDVRVVELASAGSRILARIIDLGIAVVLSLPVTVTLLLVAHRHDHAYVDGLRLHAKTTYRTLGMDAMGIALWAAAVMVVLVTAVIIDAYRLPRTGQTMGRRVVGVRVITAGTADEASSGAAATRALLFWLLALIPVVDVLALGGILWGRPYRQGLHEKLSRTLSIKA